VKGAVAKNRGNGERRKIGMNRPCITLSCFNPIEKKQRRKMVLSKMTRSEKEIGEQKVKSGKNG